MVPSVEKYLAKDVCWLMTSDKGSDRFVHVWAFVHACM